MEKLATAESRGSAPGRQFQALLDALQPRASSKKPAEEFEEGNTSKGNERHVVKEDPAEESWRRSLFASPKKKLRAHWEQVSPSVKETLHRYSPSKLRSLFSEEQAVAENVAAMEDYAGASQDGSQMLAERQSRYKQIAAFYLSEETADLSGATSTTPSHSQSFIPEEQLKEAIPLTSLEDIKVLNVGEEKIDAEKPVPYEDVSRNDAPTHFYNNDNDFGKSLSVLSGDRNDVCTVQALENPETKENCNQEEISSSRNNETLIKEETVNQTCIRTINNNFKTTHIHDNLESINKEDINSMHEGNANSSVTGDSKDNIDYFRVCSVNSEENKYQSESILNEKQIYDHQLPFEVAINPLCDIIECEPEENSVIERENGKVRDGINWSECAESEVSSDINREGSGGSEFAECPYIQSPTPAMPVGTPHIVLQAPDLPGGPSGGGRRPVSLHPPPPDPDGVLKRKSPVTVQEWVDHLPIKAAASEGRAEEPMESAAMLRCQTAARLSREASVQSSSSLDSLLDSRRPDPVEVLLNLGFGGVPGIDLDNCRIPKRFLVPSKCKGGDWDEFLRRELLQVQNFECASLGFRGLSGPSHQRPSAIVANIMEKLRERTAPQPPPKTRFTSVARRVLSETSVLHKLSPSHAHTSSSTTSVLTPDNRKFLESQGKISPEVPRRRIIFGQKSFAIDKDGELVDEETLPNKESQISGVSEVSMSSWSAGSAMSVGSVESDSEDGKSELTPSPAELLRIRRSSLQRQRNVEEGEEDDGPAIPHRFLALPEDGDDLRDALAAEMQTLTRKIQTAPPQELAAILEPIKELRVKLNEL